MVATVSTLTNVSVVIINVMERMSTVTICPDSMRASVSVVTFAETTNALTLMSV